MCDPASLSRETKGTDETNGEDAGSSVATVIAIVAAVAVPGVAVIVTRVHSKRVGGEVQNLAQAAQHADNLAFDNGPFHEAMQPRAIADTTNGVACADVGDVAGHANDAGHAQPDSSHSRA